MSKITELVKTTTKGQITIPAEMRERLKITPSTFLNVILEGDNIIIQPVEVKKREYKLRDYSLSQIKKFISQDKLTSRESKKLEKILNA